MSEIDLLSKLQAVHKEEFAAFLVETKGIKEKDFTPDQKQRVIALFRRGCTLSVLQRNPDLSEEYINKVLSSVFKQSDSQYCANKGGI